MGHHGLAIVCQWLWEMVGKMANFSKGVVMKTLKRILGLVLCLSLVMCFPLSASAATTADEDSALAPAVIPVDESSAFAAGDNTMSSNGTFNFNTRHYVTYLPFTANSSSIWIQTSCTVYNTATKQHITTDRLYFDHKTSLRYTSLCVAEGPLCLLILYPFLILPGLWTSHSQDGIPPFGK